MSQNITTENNPLIDPSKQNLSPRMQAAVASTPSIDVTSPIFGDIGAGSQNHKAAKKPTINASKVISLNVKVEENDETAEYKTKFVRLPHSGYQFDVRGLLVKEEDMIKSASTNTKRMVETIMNVLYNCISDDIKTKDHPFGSFETFCKSITQADRDTIAVAVIEKSYESTHEMTIRCPRCNHSFDEMVCLPKCMHYTYYTGDVPFLDRRQVLEFPDINWIMQLKVPSLWDELKTVGTNEQMEDLQRAAEYIFIDQIDYTDKNERGEVLKESVTNYARIYALLKNRPAIIRKRIRKEYDAFRGEYGVKGQYDTTCPACENPITVNIVPISHFLALLS